MNARVVSPDFHPGGAVSFIELIWCNWLICFQTGPVHFHSGIAGVFELILPRLHALRLSTTLQKEQKKKKKKMGRADGCH